MTQVGYARVSSKGQDLQVQLDKLTAQGCEKIYQEKQSGTTARRTQLDACLDYVREGDTLVITKLDRLARSITDLCNISRTLERKGVAFKVLDQQIDTSTSTGRLLFNMLGVIAQFETELRAERQSEGIRRAKERGIRMGREKAFTPEQIEELKSLRNSGATTINDLRKKYKVHKATIYKYLAA